MPELTPADIVSALQSRGWSASIVSSNDVASDMVPTKSSGILKCVDGRGSDNKKFGGPKLPGGIYAIAHNRHATSLSDVTSIAKEVSAAGFVPSVHGDDSSNMLGCGFFKLWITGRFDDMGYPRPEFDADQGAKAVKDAGGIIEMHHGKHTEKVVYINLCPNTTIEPNEDDQRFVVDAWIGGKFNLDIPKFLVGAAATVEMLGGPKIAKIIVPSPPLTPDDIAGALKSRGWAADIVTSDEVSHMVPTNSSGILKCVDGRGSDNNRMGGPKLPGGVYAIAHNRHATSLEDIQSIAKEVKAAGFVPSVHGDDSSDMMGCGFFKLWLTGRFDDMGYPRPEFDADQGALAVRKAGGQIEMHHGKHTEKVVYINLCPNTTIEPDENDQRFVVDAWIGGKFNLDIPKFLIGAAATVEMLGGPKIAKIIVPAPAKPLTPDDIAAALKSRGWAADIVTSDDVSSEMVPTKSTGILKCVDGRGSDNTKFGGPKLPGGIYAIAHNRHATSLDDIQSITKEVSAAGFVPSVHGDDSSDMLGCGFFKLWLTGRFDDMGYPRPQFDADQGANAVRKAGGQIEMHHGKHTEKVVYINLCPNTTIEPKEHDQRFVVDAWIGGKFNLDIPKFLIGAAATVEMLGGPKIAKIIVPAPPKPLTPADIAAALKSRGWVADVVTSDKVSSEMVPTKSTGILKCVDGRGSDNTKFGGPKLPGGIYAIAHNRHATSLDDIQSITKEVSAAGFVPSVHGDDSSDMLGCGFFKLWLTGRFDDMGYPRPQFDADQGANAVRKAGGQIEIHHGKHTEKVVYINLCPNTTIEPKEHDQRFVVDAWIGGKFNLDIPKFLVGAAATVEMLGGPKIAKIIVPAPAKPLTPADIAAALKSRGWAADVVTSDKVSSEMVPTKSTGILKCVDGRGSDNTKFGGPKLPGGIYAIAHNRHATSLSDITSITKEVSSSGFVPSVHGDDSSDMLGCGFFKLWVTGRFDDMGYPRPEFDADQGAKAVKNAGGVIEMHHGKHTEKVVYINLCPNTTIEPKEHDQRFVVDAWIGGKFNLDIPKFLVGAAATVEMLGGPKIAKIIVPAPAKPLTPADIAAALKSRGWTADVVTSDKVSSEMVATKSTGILKCVDGRGSDNTKFGGPKLPGGIYAIAHNRHATSLSDITSITKEVSSSGFVPSVHGDDSSDMLGCGFFKLWVTGRFDDMGYPRPEFDADQGAKAVKNAGGVIEMHHGKHTEKVVYINLCPNTTIEPKEHDQRFVVDAWIGGKFNLDIPKFLVGAAATVEMLGGPKIAKIIVPAPLTPADIAAALKSRGWTADVVTSDKVSSEMVPTKSTGILKCVDGRGSDNTKFGGPKLPGGIYAIAHNRHATSLSDIASITKEVSSSGFVPSVHGDDSSDMLGCGFFKLWVTGRFDDMGYPRPEFDADQGAKAVKNAGGVIEMHHGKHTEKVVYINLCPNTTIEPKEHDQRFVVDAWIGGKFNLDIPKFLVGAAATVEMLGGPKIAKIIVPALTPADIVSALESRGWDAHQISELEIAKELVPTKSTGILKCVDGRGSDNNRMGGPKLPGGIYAIAHNRHATKLADITSITKEVKAAGFVPSVHGDDSSDMLGCGFFKLWVTGRFDEMGYPRPEFDADQGAYAVKNAGGVIEMHRGKHTEKVVYINLCPNTTIEPNENDQRFVVDAWIGGKFNLDIPKFLVGAAATVEMLGGPKIAKVIVPRGVPIIEEA